MKRRSLLLASAGVLTASLTLSATAVASYQDYILATA